MKSRSNKAVISLLFFLLSVMQETWTFDLPVDFHKNPEEALIKLLKLNERDLGIFLSYYFRKDGAVAEKVGLEGEIKFQNNYSGKLSLSYDLVHFNACLAIHDKKRDRLEVNFEVDEDTGIFKLTGPYWPERGMDEI